MYILYDQHYQESTTNSRLGCVTRFLFPLFWESDGPCAMRRRASFFYQAEFGNTEEGWKNSILPRYFSHLGLSYPETEAFHMKKQLASQHFRDGQARLRCRGTNGHDVKPRQKEASAGRICIRCLTLTHGQLWLGASIHADFDSNSRSAAY